MWCKSLYFTHNYVIIYKDIVCIFGYIFQCILCFERCSQENQWLVKTKNMKAYASAVIVCIIMFVCGRITDNNFDSLVSMGVNEEVVGVISLMLQVFPCVIFGILIIGGLYLLFLYFLGVIENPFHSK
jgi:hypothetical protein